MLKKVKKIYSNMLGELNRISNENQRIISLLEESNVQNNLMIAKTFKKKNIEHLDLHLTTHCNLNCKCCTTCSPIAPKSFADIKSLQKDLTQLHSMIGDGALRIHIMGGEPLLHPQAEQFASIVRSIFSNARIDFSTNGLLVYDMPSSFWEVLKDNCIAVKYTRYPVNFDYDEMIEFLQKKGVEIFSAGGEIKYFRRIPLHTKGTFSISGSYTSCPYTDCVQLRDGKLYRCGACAFVDILNSALQERSQIARFHLRPDDYLDIHQINSKEELLEFISGPIPFCQYCDMKGMNPYVPWSHSDFDIKEWIDG